MPPRSVIIESMKQPKVKQRKVMIFNATDGIYAYPNAVSEIKASELIAEMRARFALQGYYKTASGERIAPEEVQYTLEDVK